MLIFAHQLISIIALMTLSIIAYYRMPFATKKEVVDYLLTILVIGISSSLFFGLISNVYYSNVWVLGERFWGVLFISSFTLPLLLSSKINKVDIYNITQFLITIGMVFAKMGCAISHVGCYGKQTDFILGVVINGVKLHPIPIYDIIIQLLLLYFVWYKVWFKNKNVHAGIIWFIITIVTSFLLECLKDYDKYIIGFSMPQVSYILSLVISIQVYSIVFKSKY